MSIHNCNVKSNREVSYIVIHYTGNKGPDTARANASYFRSTNVKASAHYAVDDSTIYQCIALKNIAWHVGATKYYHLCRNSSSVGIEMCCTAGNYRVSKKTIDNAVQLTVALCRIIGIDSRSVESCVLRHYDVTRKNCPAQMAGAGNTEWPAFVNRVKTVLDGEEDCAVSKTPIAGDPVATAAQMKAYIKNVNNNVPQSVIDMIPLYLSEGKAEGIRGDLAFSQSCLETGNFTFKGSAVTLKQNNFAGIGVTKNGMTGNSFSTPQLGIRAQIQHLKAYANKETLVNPCIDPRFKLVSRGCIPYIEQLGIQENPKGQGWSAGKNYGPQILDILGRILKANGKTGESTSNLLRKGDSGDSVKLLQTRLNMAGYGLQLDGIFGPLTESTLKSFQQKAGLHVDGIYGPLTAEKLIQSAIVEKAQTLATYLVKNKWHYKGGEYVAKSTFAATKKEKYPGCDCARFVSWILQEAGCLTNGAVLSHSKAGYGKGEKAVVNANKLINCKITYPDKRLAKMSNDLKPGDILVHDSSIGIYAPMAGRQRVITGRDGKTLDKNNQYKNLSIWDSGYEFGHNVLAVVRAIK